MAVEIRTGLTKLIVVGVYLSCYANNDEYEGNIMVCSGFIESIFYQYYSETDCKLLLLGDFNLDCQRLGNSERLSCVRNLLLEYSMVDCDNLDSGGLTYTYFQHALNRYSYIDHIFVCEDDIKLVNEYRVLDYGTNLSDHCPISLTFECDKVHALNNNNVRLKTNQHMDKLPNLFWSPCIKTQYETAADKELAAVSIPKCCCQCITKCVDSGLRLELKAFGESIVRALSNAVSACLPEKRAKKNKAFWNDELSRLTNLSLQTYRVWVDASRPHNGTLKANSLSAKLAYKQAIRRARNEHEQQMNEKFVNCVIDHDSKQFWYKWRKHFAPNGGSNEIRSGLEDSVDICNGFEQTFKGNFKNSDDCLHLKDKFIQCYNDYVYGEDVNTSNIVFTAEEVEQAIKGLHIEKAGGHDCLTAKHLQNSGGRLPYMLARLYNGCLSHGFVPDGFASLIIVPVPKGDGNKSDVFKGYRPVSLISIICIVFEICLLKYLKQFIIGDNLQFGFSTGKGCQ